MQRQRHWRLSRALLIAISLLAWTPAFAETGGAQGDGADAAEREGLELPATVAISAGQPAPYSGILAHPDRWRRALAVAAAGDRCVELLAESGPACSVRIRSVELASYREIAELRRGVERWQWWAGLGWATAAVTVAVVVVTAAATR